MNIRLLLIPLFALCLASAAGVLEARQAYALCGPHPVNCGGGYCCEQYYSCKPNGNSYLCVDLLLMSNDGYVQSILLVSKQRSVSEIPK